MASPAAPVDNIAREVERDGGVNERAMAAESSIGDEEDLHVDGRNSPWVVVEGEEKDSPGPLGQSYLPSTPKRPPSWGMSGSWAESGALAGLPNTFLAFALDIAERAVTEGRGIDAAEGSGRSVGPGGGSGEPFRVRGIACLRC